MSTSFSRTLTSYYIQLYLLKRKMYQASTTDVFLEMYELFKTAEEATGSVCERLHLKQLF